MMEVIGGLQQELNFLARLVAKQNQTWAGKV